MPGAPTKLDPHNPHIRHRDDIAVNNNATYVATLHFGGSSIRVHPHALRRFMERRDDAARSFAPGQHIKTPEAAIFIIKRMIRAAEFASIPKSRRQQMIDKHGSEATYQDVDGWRFVVEEREKARTLKTCYPKGG